jgi:hypothetical protein
MPIARIEYRVCIPGSHGSEPSAARETEPFDLLLKPAVEAVRWLSSEPESAAERKCCGIAIVSHIRTAETAYDVGRSLRAKEIRWRRITVKPERSCRAPTFVAACAVAILLGWFAQAQTYKYDAASHSFRQFEYK